MSDAAYAAFELATDLVAASLPDALVTYEWPGTIDVQVANDRLIVFGLVNETLDGNVMILDGTLWDGTQDVLVTDVPSDSTDPHAYADAIIDRVMRYQPGESD